MNGYTTVLDAINLASLNSKNTAEDCACSSHSGLLVHETHIKTSAMNSFLRNNEFN